MPHLIGIIQRPESVREVGEDLVTDALKRKNRDDGACRVFAANPPGLTETDQFFQKRNAITLVKRLPPKSFNSTRMLAED